jgi:hypothetical protein
MAATQDLYNDLAYYTLSHSDPSFIHQHVVDAFTAQSADEFTKPIAITFALVGLYLYVEKSFTGRQVQRMHMQLAKRRREWLELRPPQEPGAISAADVLAQSPGPQRDQMIRNWCVSVWQVWKASHTEVRELVKTELDIG